MTQYNMRCVEKVGLIKFDFLGLKTLTTHRRRRASCVRESRDPELLDRPRSPLDDDKTYDLLCSGDTEGVFQVESERA